MITYRVTLVVEYLSWADLDLGCSPGWWATIVATYCPSRVAEHAKSKSTQPRYSTTRVTLYLCMVFYRAGQEDRGGWVILASSS